jgi:hypothetical protein
MRVDRKLLELGVRFAGAMSVLIAARDNRQDELATPPASTTVGTESATK